MQDAAIIGGGLIGRLMALSLLQQGCWRVSLFDPIDLVRGRSTAHVAGGMLVPTLELENSDFDVWRLGSLSIPLWKRILSDLHLEESALSDAGSLLVCFDSEKAQFQDLCRKVNFKVGHEPFQRLNIKDLCQRFPRLNHRLHAAIEVPTDGYLDNERVMAGLAKALLEHERFKHIAEAADNKKISHLTEELPLVLDCRGFGGVAAGEAVRTVRGEILRVSMPNHGLTMSVRMVHPRFPIYIVPKSNDLLTVGATALESNHQGPVTVRSALELLSALYSLLPASGEAEILRMEVGFRAAYKNNAPKIYKQATKAGSLFVMNGFYRHGFLLGPVFCQALSESLNGGIALKDSALAAYYQEL